MSVTTKLARTLLLGGATRRHDRRPGERSRAGRHRHVGAPDDPEGEQRERLLGRHRGPDPDEPVRRAGLHQQRRADGAATTRPTTTSRYGPYFNGGSTAGGSAQFYAAADGIHFFRTVRISCSYLNEDSGWYEGSGDEIYVNAKFIDGDGGVRQVNTNVVKGAF